MNNQQEEQINSYRQAIPAFSDQLLDSDNDNDSAGVQNSLTSTLQSLGRLRRDRRSREDRAQPVVAQPAIDIPPIQQPEAQRRVEPALQINQEKQQTASHVYNAQLVANLKRRYPNGLKYQLQPLEAKIGDENRLDLADLVETDKEAREKANYFACAICTMVVKEPVECKSCDSLFCAECLDPWVSKNEHCPKKCKGNQSVEFGAMHRFAKQELESLKFKCKSAKCQNVDKYGAALKHIHSCSEQMQCCPQGCGMGVHSEDFEYHFQIQCPKTKHVCKDCDEEILPNDSEEHNCLVTLKKLLAASRKENEALRLQNSTHSRSSRSNNQSRVAESYGSSLVDEAAPISLDESDDEEMQLDYQGLLENRCHNGHILRAQYERITAYDNVSCDVCECSNLNDEAVFYRCAPCNYDLCQTCASNIELQ